ncbi:MAG TPA: class I SAM-dependent methyltransferase [Jatrophihabitans sp.]|uniref:class I SAM-dependent methyltransferase n=1 Tax=Jatrophihabitans sp. TaxID=1932789 RepID=UPI002E02A519|nr:class I SAM-dependent methyltransferase [Jatrophihabitans sp.]
MRDPWGLNERMFAKWYPKVVGLSEDAGQRETRAELIGQARGRTLELGAGNGYNLPHYPAAVTELVVTEPSPHMLAHLRAALQADPPPVGSWELVRTGAEELPFDDDSFDTVTAAFVHCTIPRPRLALREIARVLRPGGRYLFLEHVRSPDNRLLAAFQDAIAIPHTYIAAGCHPNRRIEALIADSPLDLVGVTHGHMPRSFPSVRPTIRGVAVAG